MSVSTSYTVAIRWLNLIATLFPPVSTWRLATAGKEKFAGISENWVGMDALKDPVAAPRGVWEAKAKEGTRGIRTAIRMAALQK
jgi:hypothetical protein